MKCLKNTHLKILKSKIRKKRQKIVSLMRMLKSKLKINKNIFSKKLWIIIVISQQFGIE